MTRDRLDEFIEDVGPDVALEAARRLSDAIKARRANPKSEEDLIWSQNQEVLLIELLKKLIGLKLISVQKAKELAVDEAQAEELF